MSLGSPESGHGANRIAGDCWSFRNFTARPLTADGLQSAESAVMHERVGNNKSPRSQNERRFCARHPQGNLLLPRSCHLSYALARFSCQAHLRQLKVLGEQHLEPKHRDTGVSLPCFHKTGGLRVLLQRPHGDCSTFQKLRL